MNIDASDMRIENLRIKVTSTREPMNSTPLNEQRIEIGYTHLNVDSKKDRHSEFETFYSTNLSDASISRAIGKVKKNLTSAVIDITAEARFARQFFGTTDDGSWVMLHNFTYDCKTDIISALFTIEKEGGTTWEPARDFKITDEEFWSAGMVSCMADEIDKVGKKLGFPTDVKSKTLKYSAYRIV